MENQKVLDYIGKMIFCIGAVTEKHHNTVWLLFAASVGQQTTMEELETHTDLPLQHTIDNYRDVSNRNGLEDGSQKSYLCLTGLT